MNSLVTQFGLENWKPIVLALLLPPLPFLLLILVGARLLLPRRGWGWLVVLIGVAGIWLAGCTGVARLLDDHALQPPPALGAGRIAELKAAARTGPKGVAAARGLDAGAIAIVVLGGGLEAFAPEYHDANLTAISLERLRYGVWLGRETGLPVAFSGGVGWGGAPTAGPSEAGTAARIAAQEFGRPLRWTEPDSRDTRQNAAHTIALLRRAGIRHIVLVTHAQHMPRAGRAFSEAARAAGADIRIEPAPMGLAPRVERSPLDWLPSTQGLARVRYSLRELLGLAVGT